MIFFSKRLAVLMGVVLPFSATAEGIQFQCSGFSGSRLDADVDNPVVWNAGPDSYSNVEVRITFPDGNESQSTDGSEVLLEWGQSAPFKSNWSATAYIVNMTAQWISLVHTHDSVTRMFSIYFPSKLPTHQQTYLAYTEHQSDLLRTGLPEIKQFLSTCNVIR